MFDYWPILVLILVASVIALAVIVFIGMLGPRKPNKYKDTFFECGVPPSKAKNKRFSVRFYLVAISFLLFDVEVALLFPLALVYKEFLMVNATIFFVMAIFLFVLTLAFVYEWRRGGLEWE